MQTHTTKLTVRLPRQDVEFVKTYAKSHGLTVTEVINRYLRRMRSLEQGSISPELDAITGLVPADIDAESAYQYHLNRKHR